jgi:hypothetical protein
MRERIIRDEDTRRAYMPVRSRVESGPLSSSVPFRNRIIDPSQPPTGCGSSGTYDVGPKV